jgi:hypothetical protein
MMLNVVKEKASILRAGVGFHGPGRSLLPFWWPAINVSRRLLDVRSKATTVTRNWVIGRCPVRGCHFRFVMTAAVAAINLVAVATGVHNKRDLPHQHLSTMQAYFFEMIP